MSARRLLVAFSLFSISLAALLIAPASCTSQGGAAPDDPQAVDGGMILDGSTTSDGMPSLDLAQHSTRPWQPVAGIYGGSVNSIAISTKNPANMWAGTLGAGVFRSVDGGATWNPAGSALEGLFVSVVASDPKNDGTVFAVAGTLSDSGNRWLYRSLDGGLTWKELTVPTLPGWNSFYAVLPHPKSPGVVYVLGGDGVYRSSNNGDTFGSVSTGLPLRDLRRSLAVDPNNDQILFVLAYNKVFKSTDGGVNWIESNSGLPTIGAGAAIESIAIDPRASQTVYLHAINVGKGLYKSTDGGGSWRELTSAPYGLYSITIDAMGQIYLLYGSTQGIYRSTDGGLSFSSWNSGFAYGAMAIAVHPSDLKQVYIGWLFNGITKTSDGGATHTRADRGLLNRDTRSVAFAPSDSNIVYAGLDFGGVYRSTDGGKNFAPTGSDTTLPERLAITALGVHPSDPKIVYAGASPSNGWSGLSSYPKDRLYKSIDGGATFYRLDLGPGGDNQYLKQILIDAKDPKNLIVVGQNVFRSTNEGVSFIMLNPPGAPFTYALQEPGDAARLFVYGNGYWYRSDDRGTTWNEWKSSMKDGSGSPFLSNLTQLAIDPNNPSIYYGCHRDGFYKSENAGTTWSHASVGFMDDEGCTQLALSKVQSQVVFAVSGSGKLHRSGDGATTWQPVSMGLPGATQMQGMALSPKNADVALIATFRSSGIYRTQSGGR